jgi:hypothetical protein
MKEALRSSRIYELLPYRPHNCSAQECDPQNQLTLIKRGLCPVPYDPLCQDMYICKYGVIHECSRNGCLLEGFCPVSGASSNFDRELNDYNPDDNRTWASSGLVRHNDLSSQSQSSIATIATATRDRAEYIIDTLLYSPVRQKIIDQWNQARNKRVKKEKTAYVSSCESYPVNLVHLAMIETIHSRHHSLSILDKDQRVIDHYVHLVMRMYDNIQKVMVGKIDIDSVTLGVLYKMQHGISVDGEQMIQIDPFLAEHLPLQNDLPKFGIEKTKYTKGEKLIHQALEGKNYEPI